MIFGPYIMVLAVALLRPESDGCSGVESSGVAGIVAHTRTKRLYVTVGMT